MNSGFGLHPLDQIVNVHWGKKKKGCSAGGNVSGPFGYGWGTLFWEVTGQVGYCFAVAVGLDPHGQAFILLADLDPNQTGSTAWKLQQQYPGDPGASEALKIWSNLAGSAASILNGLPGNVETDMIIGPFGQGSETVDTTCYWPGFGIGPIVYPAGTAGTAPPDLNDGKGDQTDICKDQLSSTQKT